MSQDNFPYRPPNTETPQQLPPQVPSVPVELVPARCVSVVMFVLAGIFVVFGLLLVVGALMMNDKNLAKEIETQLQPQMHELENRHPEMKLPPIITLVKIAFYTISVLSVVAAVLYLWLGLYVRKGRRGAIIGSIIVTVLAFGFILMQLLGSAGNGGLSAVMSVCVAIVPLGLMALLMGWLVPALRASAHVAQGPKRPGPGGGDWFGPGGYRSNQSKNQGPDDNGGSAGS